MKRVFCFFSSKKKSLLLALTAARLLLAAVTPLSADEAYYRVWAHALAPGYPDHPPMVALWIRAGTAVAGDTALGIRLLGPLSALLGSLLLVQAGCDLATAAGAAQPDRAGWRAAWLLNATLLLNAGAVIMTPDTPLLLFWTACLAGIARALRTGHAAWFLTVGAAAGLALDSKYTAALLAPALLAWMLAVPAARPWLRSWQVYAGAAAAVLLFLPVLVWNALHGWVSFARQGGRGGDFHLAQAGRSMAELLAGQAGLATPLLLGVFCIALVRCARHGTWRQPVPGFLLIVTGVPALVFLQHALGGRVQANWPGILYPGAALAAGIFPVPFWRPAAALGAILSAALYVQAAFAPLVLPRRLDFTLIRLAGWDDLVEAVNQARAAQGASFLAADEYGLASELAYHAAGPVLAVEPRWAFFTLPAPPPGAGSGILVRSARQAGPPDPVEWPGAIPLGTVQRGRYGVVAETYTLYRVQTPPFRTCAELPPRVRSGLSPAP